MVKAAMKAGRLGPRLIVVDIQDEYDECGLVELQPEADLDGAIQELKRRPKEFAWRFVLHPGSQDVDDIFRLAMAAGNCTVIAEEVSLYKHSTALETALLRGRRRGLSVICMTQRPYTISRTVSAQVVTSVCFWTDEPRDVGYIQERYGQEAARELAQLERGRYQCAVYGDVDLFNKRFAPDARRNVKTGGEPDETAPGNPVDQ